MGLGTDEKRIPTYYCSPRQKRDQIVDPHIRVVMYDGHGVKNEIQDQQSISGYLVDIDTVEFSPKDKPNVKLKKILITLADTVNKEPSLFKIDVLFDSHWGRTVMNSILGTPDAEVIKIGVWKDKEGNPAIGVKNNNNKTEWRFDWHKDIAPLIYEVEDPKEEGKMLKVYKKVNQMFSDAWTAHRKHVRDTALSNGWLENDTQEGPAPKNEPVKQSTSQPTQPRETAPVDTHEPYVEPDEMPF